MSEVLVSVVVATYHRDHSLAKALESIAAQTYRPVEIVLVDDNAYAEWNQKVDRIVQAFREAYPHILFQYIVNRQNEGSAKTRNIGIAHSTGDYITFLDDDDLYLPDKVACQIRKMLETQADYSLTDLELYSRNDKLSSRRIRDYIRDTSPDMLLKYHLMYHMTGTDVMMYRKEYLLRIGGFPPIDVGDEFYLMKESICGGGKFIYIPGCYVKAYIHAGDSGLSSGQSKIDGENKLYAYKKTVFKDIDRKSRRYIRMRHYAVLAFAEMRQKRHLYFAAYACRSFVCAPIGAIKLFLHI